MKILFIVYDNDSYIHFIPHGVSYLTSVLLKAGYEVDIYNQAFHHYPDEHLTNYLNKNEYDVIGLSFIAGYYEYRKIIKISEAINRSKNRPDYFILGGHGPSPEPEYFLKKLNADVVCIGESERTILELLNTISNKDNLKNVKGIAFLDGNKCIQTERQPLIKDLDEIPWPAYEKFPIEYYRLLKWPGLQNKDFSMSVLSGRGCTFTCNFCYRIDLGYRSRKPENILEEIKFLQKNYNINSIDFDDELFMAGDKRINDFCEAILKSKLNFRWQCNGRLNYATKNNLSLMKKAGCTFINYGIECFDNTILNNMNKKLTTSQIIKGVEETLNLDITPGLNIIFGNIGENRKTLMQGVDFLLKYETFKTMRTIRPITPYPGSPLYYYAIKNGLLKDVEDFYENKHVNSDLMSINFTEMSDEDFYDTLKEANLKLARAYINCKATDLEFQIHNLYENKNESFRGFRQT